MERPIPLRRAPSDDQIFDEIISEFGSHLENLTRDDKAALLIALTDSVFNCIQIVLDEVWDEDERGLECWQLAQRLSPASKLSLCETLLAQLKARG